MEFTIQQRWRSTMWWACLGFFLVTASCIGLIRYSFEQYSATRTLALQARFLALQLSKDAGLSEEALNRTATTLQANDSVVLACVHDVEKNDWYTLRAPTAAARGASAVCQGTYNPHFPPLPIASTQIVPEGSAQAIGELTLIGAQISLAALLVQGLLLALPLTFLYLLAGWHFGMRLDHFLVKPLRHIGSTAQRVSLYKDYTLRVVPSALDDSPTEIHALTASFNAMLKEIEDRDARLSRKSEELERSRQLAEAANQAKSQFLTNVSHELRTPLNAIIGFSTMMSEERFGDLGNPKYVEYSRDILASGKHLLDVINDILDLSRAETGTLSVTYASLSVPKIVERALRIVAAQAHERRVDVYTDIPEKLPQIVADPVRLVQILLNVLSNAIKFSNEGGKVVLKVRAEAARSGVYYFTLTVEDSGIGMSDEQIRKVFSSFNQADMGLNRKYDGAGLGLPLTKKLVELHHGKIKIESKLGEGTVVTVRLTSDPGLLD